MNQPRIVLKPTSTDKILEIAAAIALAILWTLIVYSYAAMPEIIPTHYTISGQVDKYGSKNSIFALPAIGTIAYIGLTVLACFPHILNYPTAITPENAEKQYRNASRLLRFVKLAISIIFIVIVYITQQSIHENPTLTPKWVLPTIFALIYIPLFFFLIRSSQNK